MSIAVFGGNVGGRGVDDIVAAAREAYGPVLREAVGALPESLRHMAGYHFGWWDTSGAPTQAKPGKGIRPALTVSTANACAGAAAAAAAAAAAVELAHNCTLIHDDIIDGDVTRRGRPTIWNVWGIADALLLGDALHAQATRLLAAELPAATAAEAIQRLEAAIIELCRAQHEDYVFETTRNVSMDQCLQMTMGKTGAVLGCACALGALCAGADPATVAAMDEFGRELGLAFQLTDDMIDIQPSTGMVDGDLVRRKRTLPIVAALESGTHAGAELGELYYSDTSMTTADITHAAELIDTAGGIQHTRQQADHRILGAIDMLPHHLTTDDMLIIAHAVTRRER